MLKSASPKPSFPRLVTASATRSYIPSATRCEKHLTSMSGVDMVVVRVIE